MTLVAMCAMLSPRSEVSMRVARESIDMLTRRRRESMAPRAHQYWGSSLDHTHKYEYSRHANGIDVPFAVAILLLEH